LNAFRQWYLYTPFLRASVMYMNSGEKIPIMAESNSMMMVFLFSFAVVFMSGLVPLFDLSSLG